jgi:hypothetical protein
MVGAETPSGESFHRDSQYPVRTAAMKGSNCHGLFRYMRQTRLPELFDLKAALSP